MSQGQQDKAGSGAVIGGWVCVLLGTALMIWSLLLFLFYAPLFFVAFVLSIVALAQKRIGHGLGLLFASLILPLVLGFGLGSYRASELAMEIDKAQKESLSKQVAPSVSDGGQVLRPEETVEPQAPKEPSALEHARENVEIYDFHAKYFDSVLDGKIPGVEFKLKNNGDKAYKWIQITVYFQDSDANVISEDTFSPVLGSGFDANTRKPLKPGYVWQMERGKFFSAKSVPSEWKPGAVRYEITKAQFLESDDD